MSPRPLRYVMVEEWTGSIGSAGATFKYNAGNREKTALNVLLGGSVVATAPRKRQA